MQIVGLDQRLYRPISDESTDRSQISGTRVWRPWFLDMAPQSQPLTIISFNIIVKHPIPAEFLPRSTAASYVDMLIATSKSRVYVTQQPLCSLNYDCK